MKGCSLFNAKYYLCNRNSERSLVILNNEFLSISLIYKSLPTRPTFNRKTLCFKHLRQNHIILSDKYISYDIEDRLRLTCPWRPLDHTELMLKGPSHGSPLARITPKGIDQVRTSSIASHPTS